MAMGIGDMRIVNKEQGIMDGDAIYSSGRTLNEIYGSDHCPVELVI